MTIRITPGPPARPSDLAGARELAQLRAGELAAVRDQADKWRTGLGGLVALATLVGAIRGVGGAAALDTAGKTVAGVLLLLSVMLSGWGSFVAMRAAYGFPTRRMAEATLEELHARRATRLRQASRDLRRAVVAAYLALALVLGSLGITWFD
jgi:hypothetical protein